MLPLPLSLSVAFALSASSGALVAAIVGKSATRAGSALALALLACAIPFLADPAPPIFRVLLAMLGGLYVLHAIDLVRDRRAYPFVRRLFHLFTPWDTRRATFGPRQVSVADIARMTAFAAPGALSIALLLALPRPTAPYLCAARWLLGALSIYTLVEAVSRLLLVIHRAVGIHPPPLHIHPILSRTLAEFWGRRWNRSVQEWLAAHVFMPVARSRARRAALALTFAVSGLLHAYLVGPATGALMAASACLYFVVQGMLMEFEPRLPISRLRPTLAHAWTTAAVLLPSPLLIEPVLRSLGV